MRLIVSSGIGNFQASTISESRVMYGPVMQANSDHSALRVMWSVNQIFPVKKVGITTYLSHCFCIFLKNASDILSAFRSLANFPFLDAKTGDMSHYHTHQHNHSLNSDLIENKPFSV